MQREISITAAVVIILALLALVVAGFFVMERRSKAARSSEIEKIIQRGVGAPAKSKP
ncbi:MAG: hypothetical protein ACP5R4_12555 [Armatimonadota bacterium]